MLDFFNQQLIMKGRAKKMDSLRASYNFYIYDLKILTFLQIR